jgi:hypothetical protein
MSHRAIRCLIGDTTKSLDDSIQFGYGRRSDFNSTKDKRFPFVWLLPLTASTILESSTASRTKTWNCVLVILDIDKPGDNHKDFNKILDDMDHLGDKIIQRIDDWYRSEKDILGTLTLQNINQTTIIKEDAAIDSGWLFSFQMVVSDDFDYCT